MILYTYNSAIVNYKFIATSNDYILLTYFDRPTYQKIIRGEGMPYYRENCDKRGDIVIKFNIQMPLNLSEINYEQDCKTFL